MKEEQNIRLMWIVSAVLLMLAGALAILFPSKAIESLTALLAILMLVSGVIQVLTFFIWKDYIQTTSWLLADGILTVVLSIIILIVPALTISLIPYILSLWLLFSGITKISSAFELKQLENEDWKWAIILGAIETIVGIVVFACPNVTAIVLGFFMGTIFLIKGISIFTTGMMVRELFKIPNITKKK